VSSQPTRPSTDAGTAIRDPTISPAPTFDIDSPLAPIHGTRSTSQPPSAPSPAPEARLFTERWSSVRSVSARMMLATAWPDGYSSFIRSTRMGV
jgi:hypothetical protein